MRIGVIGGVTPGEDGTIDGIVKTARDFEAKGLASLWMPNIFGLDAIATLAIAGRETKRIELGTAVVPTYPRHPIAMAQAGAHGRRGVERALHARPRPLAQDRDRGPDGAVVREAAPPHA